MGLVLHEAEDHVDTRPFQVPGPFQVGRLVEAGLQLHQGRDVLAPVGGLDQGRDDGAVLAGAVEGLLDGQHVGVRGGLPQELHHHVEALEGVVDEDVLLADGGEAVAPVLANPLRIAGLEGLELQVGAIGRDQLGQLRHAQHAVGAQHHHVVGLGMEVADDEVPQLRAHGTVEGDVHHRAQAALAEQGLELPHQVLGLFLHFHVGVPQQAEHPLRLHVAAGEQVIDEHHQQTLEGQIAPLQLAAAALAGGQAPEPADLLRHGHQGIEGPAVLPTPQLQGQAEGQVRDEGKGMGRVDGHGRQDREDLGIEDLAHGCPVGGVHVIGGQQLDARSLQFLAQLPPPILLGLHQGGGPGIDPFQLLGGGQAVLAHHPDALADLSLQSGDADHVELVEVVGGDGDVAQAFQQRMAGILRLFQHPLVEGQPRHLAVEEPLRRLHQRRVQGVGQRGVGGHVGRR